MTSSVATMMPPRTRCLVTVRTYAERERFMQRRQQLEQQHAAQVSAGLALSAARERGLRVERDRQDSQEAEREVTRLVRRNGPRHPPPPPPEQPPQPAQSDAQAEGEVAVKEAVTPAPPAMPSSAAPSATLVPPPPAFTTVTLTGRTSPKAGKVLAKPPLPSSDVNGLNGVTNGINGNLKSAANGPVKSAVNGTVKSAVNGAVNGANMIAIQQARLKPVHHHLLHQHQQQQPPPQPLRVTHRTPSPAPHCPTPDYDSDSSGSTLHTASTAWTASPHQGVGAQQGPEVEMQSLDSLELLEPRARQPRPPQTYFQQNRAPAPPRPSVCVTIREYGGAASRPPSKLTFLNGQQQDGSGLQGELAATLSRSNLRTRADVVDGDAPAGEEASKPSDEVNRCNVTVTALNGGRAGADPYTSKCVVPNGILKKASVAHVAAGPVGHGLTPAILAGAGAALKTKSSGVATKTISFGAKATIINEKQIST